MDGTRRVCTATKRDGRPCTTPTLPDSPYCFAHDPALANQRLAAQRKGGRNRSSAHRLQKRVPTSLRDAEAALYRMLERLETGDAEAVTANAMSSVCRALVSLHEPGDLERRLDVIERQLDELGKVG